MDINLHGSTVKCLAPKHPTKCAVVLQTNLRGNFSIPMLDISALANLGHYLVHGPAIEVLVGKDFKRDAVLVSVSLHRFQGVVPVACD